MHSVEVAVDPTNGPDNLEFRVLITTVASTANGFHPGAVLYESGTIVVPQDGDAALSVVSVNVGAVALTKGVTYAIVLDARVSADMQVGKGTVGFSYAAGTGGTDYADGFLATLYGPVGTRSQNFDDTILLAMSKFKGLAQGAITDAAFHDIGEAASNADRIIYKASGKLLFDKDGKGGDDPQAFAKLIGAPDLTAADLLVV